MHSSELDSQCVSAPTSRRAAVNVSEQQLQGSIKTKKAFQQQNIVSERVHLKSIASSSLLEETQVI